MVAMTDSKRSIATQLELPFGQLGPAISSESTTEQLDGVPNAMAGVIFELASETGSSERMSGAVFASDWVKSQPTNPKAALGAQKAPLTQGVLEQFPRALKAVSFVSAAGIEKYDVTYAEKKWCCGPENRAVYRNAEGRHMADEAIDGLWDPETKLLHAALKAWNALAELEILLHDGTPLRNPNGC